MGKELKRDENSSPEAVVRFRLDAFNEALRLSGVDDPIRRMVAVENYRVAIDPTMSPPEINARSRALLNTIEIVGCEKQASLTIDGESIESKLKRLRDRVEGGDDACGEELGGGAGTTH